MKRPIASGRKKSGKCWAKEKPPRVRGITQHWSISLPEILPAPMNRRRWTQSGEAAAKGERGSGSFTEGLPSTRCSVAGVLPRFLESKRWRRGGPFHWVSHAVPICRDPRHGPEPHAPFAGALAAPTYVCECHPAPEAVSSKLAKGRNVTNRARKPCAHPPWNSARKALSPMRVSAEIALIFAPNFIANRAVGHVFGSKSVARAQLETFSVRTRLPARNWRRFRSARACQSRRGTHFRSKRGFHGAMEDIFAPKTRPIFTLRATV